jgi:hypothetical protein
MHKVVSFLRSSARKRYTQICFILWPHFLGWESSLKFANKLIYCEISILSVNTQMKIQYSASWNSVLPFPPLCQCEHYTWDNCYQEACGVFYNLVFIGFYHFLDIMKRYGQFCRLRCLLAEELWWSNINKRIKSNLAWAPACVLLTSCICLSASPSQILPSFTK